MPNIQYKSSRQSTSHNVLVMLVKLAIHRNHNTSRSGITQHNKGSV